MATYQAQIYINPLATFNDDSLLGVSINGYPDPVLGSFAISYFPYTAASITDVLDYLGTIYISLFPNSTWTYSVDANNVWTIIFETTDETNWYSYLGTVLSDYQIFAYQSDLKDNTYAQYGIFELVTEPTTLTVCPTCYEINKSACEDSYTFVAGLTPSTVYYVVIENNRNKQYVQQVTTDGSGDFSIDATAHEFPIGFFIPEQFKYTLKVYSNSTLMNQQDITIGTTIYQCITLGFVNTVTTTASANFGVDFLIDDELNFIVDDLGNTFSV